MAERLSARMSKITNDGLTRSGRMLLAVPMATVGIKGLVEAIVGLELGLYILRLQRQNNR